MVAKNIEDIQESPICRCGSWLNHWVRLSGRELSCAVSGCGRDATEDTHVIVDNPDDLFIVPMRKYHHDQHGKEFELSFLAKLVPVSYGNCGQDRVKPFYLK